MRQTASESRSPPTGPESAVGPSTTTDAYAQIAACARGANSPEELYLGALRHIAATFDSPYAAIYIRDGSRVVDDSWHGGSADPAFWKSHLQRFLTESLAEGKPRAHLLNPKRGATKIAFLSAPVVGTAGASIGAIALVVVRKDQVDVVRKLSILESLTRFMCYAADTPIRDKVVQPASDTAAPNQALARSGRFSTPEELAFAITNHLRNKLGCEQVAMGLVLHRRVHILSVSGMDRIVTRSDGVRRMRAAMDECLDAGSPVVCQEESSWASDSPASGHRLHKQWRAAAKGDAVASIPLRVDDRTVAVLSVRKRSGDAFNNDQIEDIRKHVEPFAPALLLTRKASRGLWTHACDSVVELARRCTSPERTAAKLTGVLVLAAALWFMFGTIHYQVTTPCAIIAAHGRHITVPFDGVLESAAAMVGDRVRAGQVLCRMDAADLEHLRAELTAEIAVLEREKDRAMAEDVPVEFQLAMANQRLARAKLDSLERRIERATVVSPIDGIIIAGDLSQRIGASLTKGDALFEVAPLNRYRLELRIAERDTDDVEQGMSGRFAVQARPEQAFSFRVMRVRPRAEVRRDKNVFIAEAEMASPFNWLRPGMEGVARVDVGKRAVWWVVLHRVIDTLRMTFWL